jgi:hypothetical protein
MTRKSFDWKESTWTKDYLQAFIKVKEALVNAIEVHLPDYSKNWVGRVDASDVAVGGMLAQEVLTEKDEKTYQVISLVSHKLSEQAQRWDTIKKECYAVVHFLKACQYYIRGKPIIIETDHRNILWLDQCEAPILVRWRIFIQSFDVSIRHIPGKFNTVADWISRMELALMTEDDYEVLTSAYVDPDTVLHMMALLPYELLTLETERLESNTPVVPEPEQPSVLPQPPEFYLRQVHGGRNLHWGATQTWKKLGKHFPGHGISFKACADFVADCPICQKDRRGMTNYYEPIVRSLKPTHQRSSIGIDQLTVTPVDEAGNCNLIVIVNHFTKLVSAYPSPTYDALAIARACFQYYCTYGVFDQIWSDPGSNIMAEEVTQLNQWFGIRHVVSLVDRHESNGVEGSNKQILRHLRCLVHDLRLVKKWSDPSILSLVLFTCQLRDWSVALRADVWEC